MGPNDVTNIIEKATAYAKSLDSKEVTSAHVLREAMNIDFVEMAFSKVVNPVTLKKKLAEECCNLPTITTAQAERFRANNLPRHMRLSHAMMRVEKMAGNIAENTSPLKLGYIKMSDLICAIFANQECQSLASLYTPDNKYFDIIVSALLEYESAESDTPLEKPKSKVTANTAQDEDGEWSNFCTDLLEAVQQDDKPFVGREEELDALMQCLERRDKPNAALVGPPGVGKTDIVRGLAKKIVAQDVPEQLKNASIFSVDIVGMIAGSEYRGTFEKRLKAVLEHACEMSRPILFIDEIHMVLGAGTTRDSSMDAANILKPYLTTGKIRVIGATTEDEFRKYVESDSAFMRRFQKIVVNEPPANVAVSILEGIKPAYENFHNVKIGKEAIKAAVTLTTKHMHDRFLPDKAIDIIDQTCARVKIQKGKKINTADIESTVSKLCGIPIQTMQKDDMEKVRDLDKKLKSKVFGQDEAIDVLTEAIQMSKAGLCDETKPIGAFLFVGPSGVGKTEVTKQLAYNLGIDFVRFDMSEYGEAHTVSKLIGAPAGYVGYDDGGLLIEQVRKHPNSVILFDEIEKAHPDVFKIFLQIFDYGMLSDNKGRKADFRNTVIVLTSNAGNTVTEKPRIGFGTAPSADRKATSMKAVSEMMAPELRGRLSATIVFNPMTTDIAKLVVKKELKSLAAMLKAKGIAMTYTDKAVDELVKTGLSTQYGAREIQHVIDNKIKKLFVKKIISGAAAKKYIVDCVDDQFELLEQVPA